VRRIIRKSVRLDEDGLSIAADLDAVISINVGSSGGVSRSEARSSHNVVQGGAGQRDQPDEPSEEQGPGPSKKETP
jgi:hypothetical protein